VQARVPLVVQVAAVLHSVTEAVGQELRVKATQEDHRRLQGKILMYPVGVVVVLPP
jgi:hypothetical protein